MVNHLCQGSNTCQGYKPNATGCGSVANSIRVWSKIGLNSRMLAKHIGEWKQELKPAAHGVKYFDPYPVGSLPGWIGQKQRNCLFKVTVLFVFFSLVFVLFLFMKKCILFVTKIGLPKKRFKSVDSRCEMPIPISEGLL